MEQFAFQKFQISANKAISSLSKESEKLEKIIQNVVKENAGRMSVKSGVTLTGVGVRHFAANWSSAPWGFSRRKANIFWGRQNFPCGSRHFGPHQPEAQNLAT